MRDNSSQIVRGLLILSLVIASPLGGQAQLILTKHKVLPQSSLEELSQFDLSEATGTKTITRSDLLHIKKAELEWSCKLSDSSIRIGQPLIVEFSVTNPTEDVSFQFSPPSRGFLAANVQIWTRAEGEKLFQTADGWVGYPGKSPKQGIPVRLGPGEKRRWASRVDHFAGFLGMAQEPARLNVDWMYWMGEATFRKPGKYDVVIRYMNTHRHLGESSAERGEKIGARVFGPFRVSIDDRPAADPKWVAEVRKTMNFERPKKSDAITTVIDESVVPFAKLKPKELLEAGSFGEDVTLWLLARRWSSLRHSKDTDVLANYLEDLDKAVFHLPAHHPNRAAAEFLGLAAQLDNGAESAAFKRGLHSPNPDTQILIADWLAKTNRVLAKKDTPNIRE